MKRLLAGSLSLVLATALVAGCGGASQPAAGGSNGGSAAPAAKTLKIGLIAPMTGDVKTFGDSTKKGFDLALKQANNKAGDWTVQAVYGDDKNDPTEGVNVANKMISQDKVVGIVGSVSSKVSIPISEVANAAKVVQVTPTSTNEKVTVTEKGDVKQYIFRACFIDPFQGQVAAKFVHDTLKLNKAAILYDKANDYTVGLSNEFKKNFESLGGQVVDMESYQTNDSDFNAILTKIKGLSPDMLYMPDYYNKVSLIGKQAKALGLNVPMMGGDGWDSSDMDYQTMAGGYFTNHYSPDDKRPEVQDFVKAYGDAYKDKDGKPEKPDALAALAYDATKIMLKGIADANSNDTTKIAAALAGLKGFSAVSGSISYDPKHNPVKAAVVLQLQADKSQKFITTVNP